MVRMDWEAAGEAVKEEVGMVEVVARVGVAKEEAMVGGKGGGGGGGPGGGRGGVEMGVARGGDSAGGRGAGAREAERGTEAEETAVGASRRR
jgi:hypothetical protein